MTTHEKALGAVLSLAFLFYLLLLPRYPLGCLIDDSLSVLAAQSLRQGRYLSLWLPEHSPLTDPLPGFPALLAPFLAAAGPHGEGLKWLPLLLTFASAGLLWKVLRGHLSDGEAVAATALFALNPTVVRYSGVLVSEPFFLFLALSLFAWLPRLLSQERPAGSLLFGLILGWAMLVRPQGLVLAAALGISLGLARRRCLALWVLGPALMVWGAVLTRNYVQTQSVTGYLTHWRATLPAFFTTPGLLGMHVTQVAQTFFAGDLLDLGGVGFPTAKTGFWAPVFGLAAAGIVQGGRLFLGSGRGSDIIKNATVLFVFFYFVLHLFWSAVDERYLYPLLPFTLAFLVAGLRAVQRRLTPQVRWDRCLLGLLLAGYLYSDVRAIPRPGNPPFSLPAATYQWIRDHTPSGSFIFTPTPPTVSLYTDRFAMYALASGDLEEFRYYLLQRGLTHVLAQPVDLVSFKRYQGTVLDANARWARIQRWLSEWPGAFPIVYRNAGEGTILYSVPAAPGFIKAYELYRRALGELREGRGSAARDHLEKALRADPDLPGALNALGATLLLSGTDWIRAERAFRKALAARPDYPLAWINLARLEARRKRPETALKALALAQAIIERSQESASLLPVIAQERRSLEP